MIKFDSSKEKSLNKEAMAHSSIIFSHFDGFYEISPDDNSVPSLKGITLSVPRGELLGITGKVGSGKSALLGAVLEEVVTYRGEFRVEGSVAYVEQEPLILSATIKENILFRADFSRAKLDEVLRRTCLAEDLRQLPDGEETVVGEKGVTLSGGQKARLALARALYSDSDIYLLDDPLSAVDVGVAKRIFSQVILGLKAEGKTVLLVSHQIDYMFACDRVIIMEGGRMAGQGKPENLKASLLELKAAEEKQAHA